jgi:ribonuclease VapC
MSVVLDSSAVLASLLDEPGKEQVDAVINGAMLTTANLSEVVGYFAKLGADDVEISAMLTGLPYVLVPVDRELAVTAGMMRPAGEAAGLSLGDRMCLAQAHRSGGKAVTADRAWQKVAGKIDVDVELIR